MSQGKVAELIRLEKGPRKTFLAVWFARDELGGA